MIGLDTNVVLRYLLQDHPEQSAMANTLIDSHLTEDNPGYITVAAILEIVWVLRSSLRLGASGIAEYVDLLLDADVLVVQHERQVSFASYILRRSLGDFEDALISSMGANAGCQETVTFDRRASRLPYFRLLS